MRGQPATAEGRRHRPLPDPLADPDEDVEEGWTAMAALQREGKVRYIGVSNFSVAQMKRAQMIAPITSLQPPYSLLHRAIEAEILPFVAQENIGVVAYSPMASGLLTGAMTRERIAGLPADDWRKAHSDFREPQLSRNLELVKLLRAIGQRHGRSPGEVAVAWALRSPVVTGAIVGARRPARRGAFRGRPTSASPPASSRKSGHLSPGRRPDRIGSRARRLWLRRLRAEGPGRVALRPVRPGELALARQLPDPQLLVVRTRQRREERNEVVDISFREGERLDVHIEIRILQAIALVVVVTHIQSVSCEPS